jgi:hypothetical protein
MLHAIALDSFRASMTKAIQEVALNAVAPREAELGENVRKTLDRLERELVSGHSALSICDTVSAADTVMAFNFSAYPILNYRPGMTGGTSPGIEA